MLRNMTYDPRGIVLWGQRQDSWYVAALIARVVTPYDGESIVFNLDLHTDEYAGKVWQEKYKAIAIHQPGDQRTDKYRVGDIVAIFKGIEILEEPDMSAPETWGRKFATIPMTVRLYDQHVSFLEAMTGV